MLKKVETKAREAHITHITTVHTTIGTNQPQFTQKKFDRITLVAVLGEIPNQEAALKEIASLLKPDGILSITELIFDPHFQRRTTIRTLVATNTTLKEVACHGSWYAYTMHLQTTPL